MKTAKSVSELIRDSDVYQSLDRVFERVSRTVPLDKLLAEAALHHAQRPLRSMRNKSITIASLLEAQTAETTARSRLTEIHVTLSRDHEQMVTVLEQAEKFFLHRFRTRLQEEYSTDAARRRFIERLLSDFEGQCSEFRSAVQTVKLYIEDIDKSGYAIRNLVELLKMQLQPNRPVID